MAESAVPSELKSDEQVMVVAGGRWSALGVLREVPRQSGVDRVGTRAWSRATRIRCSADERRALMIGSSYESISGKPISGGMPTPFLPDRLDIDE